MATTSVDNTRNISIKSNSGLNATSSSNIGNQPNNNNNTSSNNTNTSSRESSSNESKLDSSKMNEESVKNNENTDTSENNNEEEASELDEVKSNVNTNVNTYANMKMKSNMNKGISNMTMKNKNGNNTNKLTLESLTKVCEDMFSHYIAMKMFHFQTDSYAAHKASDTYITAFLAFHDLFMETAQGIYGKMSSEKHTNSTMLFSSVSDCVKHIDEYRMKMKDLRMRVNEHSDLVNMLDDQIHQMNQLKYLLSFK